MTLESPQSTNVTMADVARAAGVSLSLVSLAVRDKYGVKESTRQHILETARRMNYEPNKVAARLASKTDDTLGVYLLDLHNEVFVDMYDGMRAAADAAHWELVVTIGSVTGELDKPALDSLLRARVGTAVAAGLLMSDADLKPYQSRLQLVSAARHIDGMDSVESDNEKGARFAIEHLLTLGHRNIAHLAPPISDGYAGRRRGYDATMTEAGLTPQIVEANYARDAARRASRAIFDQPRHPTAIFAHNDQAALGILDSLHDLRLRVPEDVSVVGYDNTSASRTPGIALTTIDLHAVEIGKRATELAIRRHKDPAADFVTDSFDPTLVVRGSTGPASE